MSTHAVVKKRLQKPKRGNRQHVEKYAGDAYDLAMSTAKGLQYIKKLINVEEKFFDTFAAGAAVDSNGSIVNVSLLAQGTDISNRVGDSIKLQRIRFMCWARINTSAIKTTVRVIVFRDLENAGSAPIPGDVLSGLSSSQSPIVPYNFINTRSRFKFLYDEVVALSINGLEDAVLSVDIPHSGHMRFRGSSGSTASMAQGSIWLLFVSNETTANLPDVTHFTRVEFTDD